MDIEDSLNGAEESFGETEQGIENELEAIKARVREMEEEAEKIRQITTETDKQLMASPPQAAAAHPSLEEKMEADTRSIYVGNVDYACTAEELEQHFHGCGAIVRVTIQCNKFDGHPKGFAYVEFAEKDSVGLSMTLDESLFKGRNLKIMPKRTNRPGLSTTNRFPRGSRRPRGRGGYGGYRPRRRPRVSRYYAPY